MLRKLFSTVAVVVISAVSLAACVPADRSAAFSSQAAPSASTQVSSVPPEASASPETHGISFYQDLANDKEAEKYEAVQDYSQVQAQKFSAMLPSGWTVTKPDSTENTFVDGNKATVGSFFVLSVDQSDAHLGLLPNHSDLIAFEHLTGVGLKGYDTYRLSYVQTPPAASGDTEEFVYAAICFVDNAQGLAYCFGFVKAVVDGDTITRYVSNSTIDNIRMSVKLAS